MTTIAFKDGVIAYDSRCTQGMNITDDDYSKHHVVEGSHYFMCGAPADHPRFFEADQGGNKRSDTRLEAHGLIWDGKDLWEAGFEDGKEFWKARRELSKHYSLGSGADHAITAMDMGADAKTAVKMAAKRDCGTGGRIRTFKLRAKR